MLCIYLQFIASHSKHSMLSLIRCRAPKPEADPKNRYSTYGPLSQVRTIEKLQPKTTQEICYQWVISFFENYRRQIFWAVLYTLVLFGVFIERAYCKSFRHNNFIMKKIILCIDREVRRDGVRPLWSLSRRGLDPIKVAHNKPGCQQSWWQDPYTELAVSSQAVVLADPRRDGQAEWDWVALKIQRW